MGAQPVLLDLPSEAAVLGVVRAALRALAEGPHRVRLDPREIDEVAVALQEACTNVVRHAHHGDETKRFQVELRRGANELEVLVRDHGEPFELDVPRAPEPEALQEGGYGIRIMRSWMDEVTLTREQGSNVLRLVRRYRTVARAPHAEAR